MRHTRSHTNNRRSHHKLSQPALAQAGGSTHLRHRMDSKTGVYRGRKVVDMGAKAVRKANKTKADAR